VKNLKEKMGKMERIVKEKNFEEVDFLIDALRDNNATVRIRAAKTLGKIKDSHAVEPLFLNLY
jgi:HEAT repeat protein